MGDLSTDSRWIIGLCTDKPALTLQSIQMFLSMCDTSSEIRTLCVARNISLKNMLSEGAQKTKGKRKRYCGNIFPVSQMKLFRN